jgi:hypothetical protein
VLLVVAFLTRGTNHLVVSRTFFEDIFVLPIAFLFELKHIHTTKQQYVMTDITMIPGEPESVHVNNEGAGLSSAPSPKEEEEKTMLIDIVPSTSPKIETMPMPPAIVSDPDAAAGPPLPPPPPMALPLPSQQEQQESSTSPNNSTTAKAVVSSSKKSRPPYKYDPEKVTLRFLFANKDGLTVTVECNPGDTVGEVKGALLSVWPEGKFKTNF